MLLANAFRVLLLAGLICTGYVANGQTNISGVINTYTNITAVNTGSNNVTVGSVAGFAVGDTVLLIQMQGATIDETNTASFGNITAINNAGKYEFAIICDITGNVVTFDQQLINTFSATGRAQMISVPNYPNATVTGTLTANAWNGTTGGVVVLWVENTLTLNAGIDVSNLGFRGGAFQDWGMSCNCLTAQAVSFYYANPSNQGALKGEGISAFIVGKESGKGKQANGGGGGNTHNAGGAGGGNYGAGGQGGNGMECSGFSSVCRGLNPGVGGTALGTYISTQNRIYMGGGGGAGHYANNSANNGTTPGGFGAEGAGIVIIVANTMDGNGFSINAAGENVPYIAYADAGGGGGAGGTVVLDVVNYSANPLSISANGGTGATHSWASSNTNCRGPGGGGGGGTVIFRGASLPGNVSVNVAGGPKGARLGNLTCSPAAAFNEADGASGSTVNNLSRQFSSTDYAGCNLGGLPVEFINLEAKTIHKQIELTWATAQETNSAYFEIQRSFNGNQFNKLGQVIAAGNSSIIKEYSFTDVSPFEGRQYYRIRQVDQNGQFKFSQVVEVNFSASRELISSLHPNPVNSGSVLTLDLLGELKGETRFLLTDAMGKLYAEQAVVLMDGQQTFDLVLPQLAAGIYFVRVLHGGREEALRFAVVR